MTRCLPFRGKVPFLSVPLQAYDFLEHSRCSRFDQAAAVAGDVMAFPHRVEVRFSCRQVVNSPSAI